MKPRRRMTLQLTSLLDLLLIVIFAQWIEVRDRQQVEAATAQAAIVARDKAEAELKQQEESATSRVASLEQVISQQKEQLEQAEADLDRALAQHRLLGELVVELFQIPSEDVNHILDPAEFAAGVRSPEELARLRERFREMSMQQAGKMVEHLLSYEEIRKRCDVWNLHLDEQGIATLSDGQRSTRLRIPMLQNGDVDVERFVSDVYTWYRSIPQPKSLVVILLTYDRQTRIVVTEGVRMALPVLTSRMQTDAGGRIRFEYADLGFRIE